MVARPSGAGPCALGPRLRVPRRPRLRSGRLLLATRLAGARRLHGDVAQLRGVRPARRRLVALRRALRRACGRPSCGARWPLPRGCGRLRRRLRQSRVAAHGRVVRPLGRLLGDVAVAVVHAADDQRGRRARRQADRHRWRCAVIGLWRGVQLAGAVCVLLLPAGAGASCIPNGQHRRHHRGQDGLPGGGYGLARSRRRLPLLHPPVRRGRRRRERRRRLGLKHQTVQQCPGL
mmetsp:Transcript_19472/g.56592  ORF Transcript_19472/g.56592 Transcript_19472/m.56592 type:complete len:233 (-) Transcript_19472:44-742(-)